MKNITGKEKRALSDAPLSDLIASKLMSDQSIGKALKSAIDQKIQSKVVNVKNKFDILFIAKVLTGNKVPVSLLAKVMGIKMGEVDEYMEGKKKKKKVSDIMSGTNAKDLKKEEGETEEKKARRVREGQKETAEVQSALKTKIGQGRKSPVRKGDSVSDVLAKMYNILEKSVEDKRLQQELEKDLHEQRKVEEKRRHDELIKALKNLVGDGGSAATLEPLVDAIKGMPGQPGITDILTEFGEFLLGETALVAALKKILGKNVPETTPPAPIEPQEKPQEKETTTNTPTDSEEKTTAPEPVAKKEPEPILAPETPQELEKKKFFNMTPSAETAPTPKVTPVTPAAEKAPAVKIPSSGKIIKAAGIAGVLLALYFAKASKEQVKQASKNYEDKLKEDYQYYKEKGDKGPLLNTQYEYFKYIKYLFATSTPSPDPDIQDRLLNDIVYPSENIKKLDMQVAESETNKYIFEQEQSEKFAGQRPVGSVTLPGSNFNITPITNPMAVGPAIDNISKQNKDMKTSSAGNVKPIAMNNTSVQGSTTEESDGIPATPYNNEESRKRSIKSGIRTV